MDGLCLCFADCERQCYAERIIYSSVGKLRDNCSFEVEYDDSASLLMAYALPRTLLSLDR
jgi:hypothetical protein